MNKTDAMSDGDRQPLSAEDWTRLAPAFAAASAHRRVSWAWVEPEARGGFAAGLGYLRSAAILVPADSTEDAIAHPSDCLLYTSPSPRDQRGARMPSSA